MGDNSAVPAAPTQGPETSQTASKLFPLRKILDQASELPRERRQAACGAYEKLRGEIESLLDSLDRADGFLSEPTLGPFSLSTHHCVTIPLITEPGNLYASHDPHCVVDPLFHSIW